jgi:acid phosphatase type 7
MLPTRPDRRRAVILASVAFTLGLALLVIPRLTAINQRPSVSPSAGPSRSVAPATPSPSAASSGPSSVTLLAAGDVASCDASADEAVATAAGRLSGTIALLGDNAYPDGSADDYAHCFDPAWGSLRDRIRPVPGNHDYQTKGASGYFGYFGSAAGVQGQGWYSYDLGAWHLIALNSECDAIGGCGAGSAQLTWLKADLAAYQAACTLAYWHHPRFSSGMHGDDPMTDSLWAALAAAGSEIVLSGHDHDYERLAPVDGIREFVVGTGGRSLYEWPGSPGPHTEVRANDTYGLLELELDASTYTWRFVPAAGGAFSDAGSGTCH